MIDSKIKKFRKTINHMFKNKPNACINGDTFDATHLQRIICRPYTASTHPGTPFQKVRKKLVEINSKPFVDLTPKLTLDIHDLPDYKTVKKGDCSKKDANNPQKNRNAIDYEFTKYNQFLQNFDEHKSIDSTKRAQNSPDFYLKSQDIHQRSNDGVANLEDNEARSLNVPKSISKSTIHAPVRCKNNRKVLVTPKKSFKTKDKIREAQDDKKLSACFRSVSRDTPCSILKDKSNDLLTKNARITGFQDIQEYKNLIMSNKMTSCKNNMIRRGIVKQLDQLQESNKVIKEIRKISLQGKTSSATLQKKISIKNTKKANN
ncbi:unnamed protein product [Moneuplotes crassus]|uniref:Uncharacterized protein n=1 Tax=Euplotes crassus TaxID=5936 RepID=A0AAD1UJ07_EUPCR|nr:unnamed protein product [Moneuplotes crassus]